MSQEEKNERKKNSEQKDSAKRSEKEDSSQILLKKLKEASEGLFYISESEAGFEPFVWHEAEKKSGEITAGDVLKYAGAEQNIAAKEQSLDDFFAQPTDVQDWFGDEEKAQVEKFIKLKELLQENLKNIKVFKIGETNIDVYVVGTDENGNLSGVKTSAVET